MYTAPSYRFRTALVLAVLLVICVLVGLTMVYTGRAMVEFEGSPVMLAIKSVLVLAGASFGVLGAWRAQDQVPVRSLTPEGARQIVEHAEAEFASGRKIDDAFAPFAERGAASRQEARNALLIVVADFYRHAALSGDRDELALYEDYAASSRFIATRIVCDAIVSPAEIATCAKRAGSHYESFVALLRTLDPAEDSYWASVSKHIETM